MTQPLNASSSNPAPIASQGVAARRLDSNLAKLTAATAVKPAPRPAKPGDGAALTDANVLKVVRETAPLRELGAKLIDLRRLIAQSHAPSSSAVSQATLDKVAASIDAVSASTPAQTALLFDGPYLDLSGEANDASAQLHLELSGPGGVREFWFTSGTAIPDLAQTLDLAGAEIGVSARVSGNAVVIESEVREGREFVGVRVINGAGANFAGDASPLAALRDALKAQGAPQRGASLLTRIDDAIREVERAEREQLLARAGGDIALSENDIPVIREAQARLIEEAHRLGLLVDHDPAKALEALRG